MRFSVVTLFPELIDGYLGAGVLGRGVRRGLVDVGLINPRDFTTDTHRTVDDRPYGGGPGMVMKPEPLYAAIEHARAQMPAGSQVVLMSPQGQPLRHRKIVQAAAGPGLILVCGRYEGIDERLIETAVDAEWSLGDFVLSGGELAALVIIDAIARLVPGVLGHDDSAVEDSFVSGLLDCPHYTRPPVFMGKEVPAVLLSGNHEDIRRWRHRQALLRTWQRRPDLICNIALSAEDKDLLSQTACAAGGQLHDRIQTVISGEENEWQEPNHQPD